MVDIHSHILPRFDDGPETLEQSIILINAMIDSGVTEAVSTSHFYSAYISVEEFADIRQKRIAEVKKALDEKNIDIRIYSGAEVNISRLILNSESLKPLCFEGTNCILLEIPHGATDFDSQLELIERIISYYNVRPIIAHVERYDFFLKKMINLHHLKDKGCIIQADAQCFLGKFRDRHFGIKAIKAGLIDVVASDCHDTLMRKPNLDEAYNVIEKKIGINMVEMLKSNAEMLVRAN